MRWAATRSPTPSFAASWTQAGMIRRAPGGREGGRYWLRGETPPGETDPVEDWMKIWERRRANPREMKNWSSRMDDGA